MGRVVCWFSCGAASAVAAKLTIAELAQWHPESYELVVAYCETGSEHPDNERFLRDCEAWFGRKITRLSNAEYIDTWDVWEQRRYIAGFDGAPCTGALKKQPRIAFQRPGDVHVFGYTADREDVERAERFVEHNLGLTVRLPLVERGVDKAACLAMVANAGIALPPMYALGFQNNNCIPCPKATSPNYWSAVRLHFPEQFGRMAKLSRDLGVRLAIIGREKGEDGKVRNIRAYIDEIPADQPTTNPIAPACDFLCHIAEQDMRAA